MAPAERERESWEKFWEKQADEVREEINGQDIVTNNYELREFVSKSGGRGRKRRRPKEVALVIDRNTGRSRTLKDVPTGGLDIIAQGLLGNLPGVDDPFPEFVRRLRVAQKQNSS